MTDFNSTNIWSHNHFEAWLKSRPENSQQAEAAALSSRCALRVLSYVQRIWRNDALKTAEHIKFVLWQSLIARTVLNFPHAGIASAQVSASVPATVSSASHLAAQATVSHNNLSIAALAALAAFSSIYDAKTSDVYAASPDSRESDVDAFAGGKAKEIWKNIQEDARALETGSTVQQVMRRPIWLQVPADWHRELELFRSRLLNELPHGDAWRVWLDWYGCVVEGKPAFGVITAKSGEDLEKRIVLGDRDNTGIFNERFWARESGEVNREIASWVAEAQAAEAVAVRSPKPIFISYTTSDLIHVRRIGEVIDADGYSVFAQYKDMPPGSNFVAQMQTGLASMGKFVPVYSPRYLTSDHCQAEWNAAYNMDPLGKRKLIVGFLLEKTELLPLQKQTVYVPLYGLTETQAKSAILTALSTAGAERTPLQTRKAAKDYAVPVPETNATGQLSFVPSADVEQPFIDDDIARLPSSMLRVLGHLLDALEGPNNAPQLVESLLRGLQGELTVNGAMARVPDLQRDIEMLLAERGRALRDGAVWADGGFGTGINQLEAMFSSYRQNFPLVMVREIERRQAAIDPAKFDDAKFKMNHESIAAATEAMGDAGQTDASVAHVVFQRQRQRRDIEILGRYVPQGSDRLVVSAEERTVEELKKDFMFDESGLWDRTLGRVEKVASIADSTGGKALIVAAKEFLKSIWGG